MAGKAINAIVHHIRERFPDKTHRIDLLLVGDSDFLALSEDYNACVNALRYWAQSNAPEAEHRILEYHTLIKELEDDVCQYLAAPKPPPQD